jgi:guanylate kinase
MIGASIVEFLHLRKCRSDFKFIFSKTERSQKWGDKHGNNYYIDDDE